MNVLEPEVLPMEALHYENGVLEYLCYCDLNLGPYLQEIYLICENERSTSRLSEVIVFILYRPRMCAFSYARSLPVT